MNETHKVHCLCFQRLTKMASVDKDLQKLQIGGKMQSQVHNFCRACTSIARLHMTQNTKYPVRLSVCLVRPSVCLSVLLSIRLSVCLCGLVNCAIANDLYCPSRSFQLFCLKISHFTVYKRNSRQSSRLSVMHLPADCKRRTTNSAVTVTVTNLTMNDIEMTLTDLSRSFLVL